MPEFIPKTASLHGDGSADELLVAGEVGGTPRNVILTAVPDLTRRLRAVARSRRDALESAQAARTDAARVRDEKIENARRAMVDAQNAAADEFQSVLDATEDQIRAAHQAADAERAAVEQEAFVLAPAQFEKDTAPPPLPEDNEG